MKKVYFAGGCFWCIASVFDGLDGVIKVVSGYSGGDEVNPTYMEVKKQLTNHREAIEITLDEEKISYEKILDLFLDSVDPFDDGGQFIDRGHSYTLAIFYNDDEEKELALKKIKAIEEKENKEVKISVEKFKSFYDAEEEHQDYAKKNPEAFEKELIESGRK